jgi:hypothetical protein
MTRCTVFLALSSALALAACSGSADEPETGNTADDFAARINGNGAATPAATGPGSPPRIAKPLANAAPGPFTEGTATDPESKTCGANRMGPFLNQPASDSVRSQIMEATSDVQEVRFIAPGSDFIRPDPTNPRLNIMIDGTGVIRDARCG